MSASAINAVAPPPPSGPAPGIGQAAATASGPLAGFEALLATFFGIQGIAGDQAAAGQPSQTPTVKAASLALAGESVDAKATGKGADDDTTAAIAVATDAAAQAACNAALILPHAPILIVDDGFKPTTAAGGEAGGAAAFGLGKLAGQPAAPALPSSATKAEQIAAALDAEGAPTAKADQKGQDEPALAQLDPRAVTKLATPQPVRLAVPPQVPTPPPVIAAAPAPQVPIGPAVTPPVVEALAAPPAAVEADATEGAAPVAPKEKAQNAKLGRNAHGRVDAAPTSLAPTSLAPTGGASATWVAAATSGKAADDHIVLASLDSKAEAADAPTGSADAGAATGSTTTPATQVHLGAVPVRGSPQTVANLAAQIVKKLEGRSTRFDLQLDPAGLGRVDVHMEIGASGRMTAAMTFDTPAAAAELRARAAELQRHLEQAGFDMSGGLSFDVAGDRGQGRQAQHNQDNDNGQAFRGRAFQQALATAGEAAQSAASGALNLRRSLLSGVDIRI